MLDELHGSIYDAGVYQFGFINPAHVEYHQMVRNFCKDNSCGLYGQSWACPPAVGTLEECKESCLQYDTMMLFSGLTFLEGPFDIEGMKNGMSEFKKTARSLEAALSPHIGDHLVLSNEGCGLCAECTYPDSPCRFPDKLHHSIEGYGFLVSDLSERAGIGYNNGQDTVTFFGAVLFNKHL